MFEERSYRKKKHFSLLGNRKRVSQIFLKHLTENTDQRSSKTYVMAINKSIGYKCKLCFFMILSGVQVVSVFENEIKSQTYAFTQRAFVQHYDKICG